MPQNHPRIPADIERQVLIEAGHRCAVCGAELPLDRAHIIAWSRSNNSSVENLLCLCANCHRRAETEGWGEEALRQYKKRPWVIRAQTQEVASGAGARVGPPSEKNEEERRKEASKDFDVFLSHNSKDKLAVRKIAEALRHESLRPWLDEDELIPGRPWQKALDEIIETCRTAAVLVGPSGLGPWQEPEMMACLSEFVNRKLPVLLVLLPGAPDIPKLPLLLKTLTWVDMREGLSGLNWDHLIWGITGKKPVRSKPRQTDPEPSIDPALTTPPASPTSQVSSVSPEDKVFATVPTEEHATPSDQRALSQKRAEPKHPLGFSQALLPSVGWTFAFSAAITTFQTIVDWPDAPTLGNWFWFLVRWLVLGAFARIIGAIEAENKNRESPSGTGPWGLLACAMALMALGIVLDSKDLTSIEGEGGPEPNLFALFFPGKFLSVTSAALAGGLIYSSILASSVAQFLSRWLFWVVAWSFAWWLSVYLLGLIRAGQIDPFTTVILGILFVSWWVFLIHLGLARLRRQ
jgi:TIR domain-containing protein/HNH endonuclease